MRRIQTAGLSADGTKHRTLPNKTFRGTGKGTTGENQPLRGNHGSHEIANAANQAGITDSGGAPKTRTKIGSAGYKECNSNGSSGILGEMGLISRETQKAPVRLCVEHEIAVAHIVLPGVRIRRATGCTAAQVAPSAKTSAVPFIE